MTKGQMLILGYPRP